MLHHVYFVIDDIRDNSHLEHLSEMDPKSQSHSIPPIAVEPNLVCLGGGLPPVSGKLAKKIEERHYIAMAELFPEHLTSTSKSDDQSKPTRSKRKISNILESVQCFNIYIAVITCKQPNKVVDLLGYQHLIIQAHQEYQGDGWLGYNRCFRQRVTFSSNWSTIDATLWNLIFSGRGSSRVCNHCLSASHVSRDCEFNSGNELCQLYSNRPSLRPQVCPIQG